MVVTVMRTTASPDGAPELDPPMGPEEAHGTAARLIEETHVSEYTNDEATRKHAALAGLDERSTRRLAQAIAAPCLAVIDGSDKACIAFDVLAGKRDKTLETLVAYLGDIAETKGYTPTMRLLVRLGARGSTQAEMALEEILERRMLAMQGACVAPSAAERETSKSELGDFVIVEPGAVQSKGTSATGAVARSLRKPTASELDDLAYFLAAVSTSGKTLATLEEDRSARALPANAPDLAVRADLRKKVHAALAEGDLETHALLARRYLETLGYPGKIRVAEEGDERWGGHGFSYVMRDLARTDEILGRLEEASTLYRRANPGGGVCGTSSGSMTANQIEAMVRTAEETSGCRTVVAERLYSVALDRKGVYGTPRLAAAGFDVAKLYRAALLTLGRDKELALEQTFAADAQLGQPALGRLRSRGTEAWATRTRAVAGYGALLGKSAFPALQNMAEHGFAEDRLLAISTLGKLAEDHGNDACLGFGGWGGGDSRMSREVDALSHTCATKLAPADTDDLVKRLAVLGANPDPGLREAVAIALGRSGAKSAVPVLTKLARDTYSTGGKYCVEASDRPEVCGPDRPVRRAAEEGLELVKKAESERAEERARARTEGKKEKASD